MFNIFPSRFCLCIIPTLWCWSWGLFSKSDAYYPIISDFWFGPRQSGKGWEKLWELNLLKCLVSFGIISTFLYNKICTWIMNAWYLVFCVCLGIPSTGCVKYLYIEKELIPAVWKVFLILVITSVLNALSDCCIVLQFNLLDKHQTNLLFGRIVLLS